VLSTNVSLNLFAIETPIQFERGLDLFRKEKEDEWMGGMRGEYSSE